MRTHFGEKVGVARNVAKRGSCIYITMEAEDTERLFKPGEVAFGSRVERLMFPIHTAPTRLGIEQGLRGEPHRGPGCYSSDPLTEFLKPLDSVPRSKKGWYFGASQVARSSLARKSDHPGPPDYQTVDVSPGVEENKKGFNNECPRWQNKDSDISKPGPGTYEHELSLGRQVKVDEAFGTSRTLHNAVVMKCTKGIPDTCRECKEETVGDYYQKGERILCRECYKEEQIKTAGSHKRNMLKQYHKVRDCREVHQHKFPGKDPKIILKSESELKKQSSREAYFRLYFTD